jgi:hypothetical protein
MKNKLYLISQDFNADYDTYDSFVVSHSSESKARSIHPAGGSHEMQEFRSGTWCSLKDVDRLTVQLIGETEIKAGTVVISSFNGG